MCVLTLQCLISTGTCALLEACKEAAVKRLIYCSSMSVVLGLFDIIDGTESSPPHATAPLHNGYATSKQKAESIVIQTNSKHLADTTMKFQFKIP